MFFSTDSVAILENGWKMVFQSFFSWTKEKYSKIYPSLHVYQLWYFYPENNGFDLKDEIHK